MAGTGRSRAGAGHHAQKARVGGAVAADRHTPRCWGRAGTQAAFREAGPVPASRELGPLRLDSPTGPWPGAAHFGSQATVANESRRAGPGARSRMQGAGQWKQAVRNPCLAGPRQDGAHHPGPGLGNGGPPVPRGGPPRRHGPEGTFPGPVPGRSPPSAIMAAMVGKRRRQGRFRGGAGMNIWTRGGRGRARGQPRMGGATAGGEGPRPGLRGGPQRPRPGEDMGDLRCRLLTRSCSGGGFLRQGQLKGRLSYAMSAFAAGKTKGGPPGDGKLQFFVPG